MKIVNRGFGFTSEHREAFQALLAVGELFALNQSEDLSPSGPWALCCDHSNAEIRCSLKARFNAAARKAAIACRAPRGHLLNWWITALARDGTHPFLRNLVRRSIEYCEQLESNAAELQPVVGMGEAPIGLNRDRYFTDANAVYWLYEIPHDPFPNATDEFAFWSSHIWAGFNSAVQELLGMRYRGRRTVDREGNSQVESKEETRARVRNILAFRTERLDAFTLGLAYDLAVLQANYILDRGLRRQIANDSFDRETEPIIEQLHQVWRASSKLLGLSVRKRAAPIVDFSTPFSDVRADLQCLLSDIDSRKQEGRALKNQHLPKRDEGSDQPEDWITEQIELQTLRDLRTGLDNISQKIRDAQNDSSYRIDPSWRRQLQILFGEMVSAGIQTADCDFDENPDSVLCKIHTARTSVQLRMGWLETRVAAHKRPTKNSLGATTHAFIDPLQVPGEFRQLPSQAEQNVAKSGDDSTQQSARRTRGAPQKPVAEKTRARWIEMGEPEKLDAAVCDQLAQYSYPEEFAKASPHSAARKRLRDRVASQVRRLIHKTAPPT